MNCVWCKEVYNLVVDVKYNLKSYFDAIYKLLIVSKTGVIIVIKIVSIIYTTTKNKQWIMKELRMSR